MVNGENLLTADVQFYVGLPVVYISSAASVLYGTHIGRSGLSGRGH
jgi:hypothetical protein